MSSPAVWPPVIGVSGKSNSGKTLLIQTLIPRLIEKGVRVAVVKHCTHYIEADTPGKDSDRIFQAGANVLAAGPDESFARFHGADAPLWLAVRRVALGCDVCLVEGYRGAEIPRIEVQGSEDSSVEKDAEPVLLTVTDVPAEIEAVERVLWDVVAKANQDLPTLGIVLIGGRSSRMGQPKSMMQDGSASVLERIVSVLEGRVDRVLLGGSGPVLEKLNKLERVMDAPSVAGPLAGILAAMRWQPAARWLVLACDLPFVESGAVEWLLSQSRVGVDAVMPRLGEESPYEPLFAIYEPTCLPLLEAAALEKTWSMRKALEGARVAQPLVPPPLRRAWTNVNTIEDWDSLRR